VSGSGAVPSLPAVGDEAPGAGTLEESALGEARGAELPGPEPDC
jgi:hypothetical protein